MRIAPGSFIVLCSNGYFIRTSSNTGRAAGSTCSSLVFRASRVMRGTGTAAILAVSRERFQVAGSVARPSVAPVEFVRALVDDGPGPGARLLGTSLGGRNVCHVPPQTAPA